MIVQYNDPYPQAKKLELGMHIDDERTGEARNFKFSTINVDHVRHEQKNAKLGQTKLEEIHGTYF